MRPRRIATFNAGLAVGVLPYANERVPVVARALADLDVDVLFVQEVWLEPHWDRIRDAVRARLPFAFRPPPAHPAHEGACTEEEVAPLLACAQKHCAGLASEDLARCVVSRCAATAAAMSPDCVNCIVRHPVGTVDDIVRPCVAASGVTPERSGVTGMIAYGGSFGTALMSSLPLEDPDVLVFEASVNARCALHAVVGDLHVFATHLSPGIAHEQRTQIDRLLAWVDEKARGRPTVLLGDLNTGPGIGSDVSAHLPSLYRSIEAAGFVNPYTARDRVRCTYPLGGRSGWLLDHVLFRGIPATDARAERILDEPVAIEAGGRRVETTCSDHYGVKVTLPPRA